MLKHQICIAMTDVPKNKPERNLSSAASYPVGLGLLESTCHSFSRDFLTAWLFSASSDLDRRTEAFG